MDVSIPATFPCPLAIFFRCTVLYTVHVPTCADLHLLLKKKQPLSYFWLRRLLHLYKRPAQRLQASAGRALAIHILWGGRFSSEKSISNRSTDRTGLLLVELTRSILARLEGPIRATMRPFYLNRDHRKKLQ